MKIETVRFPTALAAFVDIGASGAVAREDGASYGCRDVSTGLASLILLRGSAERSDFCAALARVSLLRELS
mgnify:CR=1 FL=1